MISAKQLYEEYMSLSIDEIDKYIDRIIQENHISDSMIYKKITDYAKTQSKEQYDMYNLKRLSKKVENQKYVNIIDEYLKNPQENQYLLLLFGQKEKIISKLEKYSDIFVETKEKIKETIDNIDEIINPDEEQTKKFLAYLDIECSNTKKNKFELVRHLLKLSNEEAIEYLQSKSIRPSDLKHWIISYQNSYPYCSLINNKLEFICSNLATNPRVMKNHIAYRAEKSFQHLKELLLTEYTKEEYAAHSTYTLSEINTWICDTERYFKEEYVNIKKELDRRQNSERQDDFEHDLKILSYKIVNSKQYNLIDYYKETALSVRDFINIANRVIYDQKVIKRLSEKLHILDGTRVKRHISKINELECITTKFGKTITREEKEKIFEYMEEHLMPIDTYFICLNEYVKGNLQLDKEKVKSK